MMVRRADVRAPLERNELAGFLLELCVLSGLFGLLSLAPNSNASHLPAWLNLIWYLLLFVGGAGAVAGTYWRDPLTGLLIERAALWPVGAGAAMYAVALAAAGLSATTAPTTACQPSPSMSLWLAAGITLWFAIVATRRAIRIPRMLRRLRIVRPAGGQDGAP